MRRIGRKHCRNQCMGCDDCWICRRSYPDSITIDTLSGYGPACCTNLIGTYAAATWGNQYDTGGVLHYGFGTTNNTTFYESGKPKCLAIWSGRCNASTSPIQAWTIYLFAGTLTPFVGSGAGGATIAADAASTRLDALIYIRHLDEFGVILASRTEHYRVNLPKPCPESGNYELLPVGVPEFYELDPDGYSAPACLKTENFEHSVEVEIVAA